MSETIESVLARATTFLDEDQPELALDLLNAALEHAPDETGLILLKSESLVLLDEWEEAEELLQGAAGRGPNNASLLLALADLLIDFHPDDPAVLKEAYEMAMRGEALIGRRESDTELMGELRRTAGRALIELGDSMEAVRVLESARPLLNDEPELLIQLALAQFEALLFDDCRALLSSLPPEAAKDARVHHYLGLLDERSGLPEQAEGHFAEARRLDPDEFPAGVSLSRSEFDEAVERAMAALPPRVASYLENVPVLVEDLPSIDDLAGDPPLSPLSLGMFRGTPGPEKSHFDPWSNLPSSIVLFQKNLERYTMSREELLEEIETTVLHEVGHYLGWDEDDLYEHDLE
jgi:predicted Zn-dependent protease with MMP-like domain